MEVAVVVVIRRSFVVPLSRSVLESSMEVAVVLVIRRSLLLPHVAHLVAIKAIRQRFLVNKF